MKLRKTIYITFLVTYLFIVYLTANMVGIKFDATATLFDRFLVRAEAGIKVGWQFKLFASLVFAIIVDWYINVVKKFREQ